MFKWLLITFISFATPLCWGFENELSLAYAPSHQLKIKSKGVVVSSTSQDFSLSYISRWTQPWGALLLGASYGKTLEPNISALERFSLLGGATYSLSPQISLEGKLGLGLGHLSYHQPLINISSTDGRVLSLELGILYKITPLWNASVGVEYLEQIYGSSRGEQEPDLIFSSLSPILRISYSF